MNELEIMLGTDVDDITNVAGKLSAIRRRQLLSSAAGSLRSSANDITLLKTLRFVQAALASLNRGQLPRNVADPLTEAVTHVFECHDFDPAVRFSALAILGLLATKGRGLSSSSTQTILTALERAKADDDKKIRELADNVLSARGPIFREYFERLKAGRLLFGTLQPAVYDAAEQLVYVFSGASGRVVRMSTDVARGRRKKHRTASPKKLGKFVD
jgi:hypothetical protein